jgi:hypothetical protein
MKLYNLVRKEDVSGSSGTGIVAEIVEFEDLSCVMRWKVKDKPNSFAYYSSIEDIILIHGHEGRTTIKPWTCECFQ